MTYPTKKAYRCELWTHSDHAERSMTHGNGPNLATRKQLIPRQKARRLLGIPSTVMLPVGTHEVAPKGTRRRQVVITLVDVPDIQIGAPEVDA